MSYRKIVALLAMCLFLRSSWGQSLNGDVLRLKPSTPPALCNNGDLRIDTTDSNKLKVCVSNSFTAFLTTGTGIPNPMTTTGDILINNTTPSRLAVGSNNQVLKSNGTIPGWGLIIGANIDSTSSLTLGTIAVTGASSFGGNVTATGNFVGNHVGNVTGNVTGRADTSGTASFATTASLSGTASTSGTAAVASALASTSNCSANQWAIALSTGGVLTCSAVTTASAAGTASTAGTASFASAATSATTASAAGTASTAGTAAVASALPGAGSSCGAGIWASSISPAGVLTCSLVSTASAAGTAAFATTAGSRTVYEFVGQHGADCRFDIQGTGFSTFTADNICTFSTRSQTNITVTSINANGTAFQPGIVFTAPATVTLEVCADVAVVGPASDAAALQLGMLAGTVTIAVTSKQTIGTGQEVMRSFFCGHMNITSAVVYTASLVGAANSGTITMLAPSGTNNQPTIHWTLKAL